MGRQAFHTVLTRGFVTIMIVLQSSLWTRMLAPEGRGLYAKLQASLNLFILLLGFGVTSGIVYFGSSRRVRADLLWTLALIITLLGTLVTVAIITLGSLWPPANFIFPIGYQTSFFIFYFVFTFVQSQLQVSMNSFLAAEHRFSDLNRIEILSALLRFFMIAIAYFWFRDVLSLMQLFLLDLAFCGARSVLHAKYFSELKISVATLRWTVAKPVLLYSGTLYVLYVIQFLYQRIDIWIIERTLGLISLGIFSSAVGLAQYLTMLPIALSTVLTPHLTRTGGEEAYHHTRRFPRINSTLLVLPVLVLALFPRQILTLFYGEIFATAGPSLRILGIAYWFVAAKHLFIYFNAARGRLTVNFYIESLGLFLGTILNLCLIPIYGIEGAAYAFLTTGVVTGVLSYMSVRNSSEHKKINFFFLGPADFLDLIKAIRKR